MNIAESIVLAIVQGLTEFLPVSSSGHLILVRELISVQGEYALAFDALLHFATAAAIVVYFWRDIYRLAETFFTKTRAVFTLSTNEQDALLIQALVAGTIPAVALGLLLEDILDTVFRNPLLVAGALVAGSMIMLLAERYQGESLISRTLLDMEVVPTVQSNGIGWLRGLYIGLFQSLALIPGMSRSGMTISGGMLLGLGRAEAASFGFLLGVPLFLGAGTKKFLELGSAGMLTDMSMSLIVGVLAAFATAILVIHYLLRFLRTHTLYVFVWYRLALAALIAVVVLF
jgi:undecaprenyl-diphosphatase